MTCELISVGTELLLGDIVNTNAQYLAKELASLGIDVNFVCTVGDNDNRLKEVLKTAFSNADMVITTGGLGPTADDITKEVCCDYMNEELVLDKEWLEKIENYFKRYDIKMPESNKKQAYVPKNGIVFRNLCGTAPGCAIEKDGKVLILLPGPPREMKSMFDNTVKPYLSKFSEYTIVSHNIRTFGIGESAMAEKVADLLEQANPTVAPYAKEGEALLRITAKATSEAEAEQMIDPVIEDMKKRFGSLIYGIDADSLAQTVVNRLGEAHKRVALAESCTGGMIAKSITDIPGSSAIFECGIVSYSNDIKNKILNVDKGLLDEKGAVCEEVAIEMAKGALEKSGADIGIGVTGVAGPGPDGDIPEGVIYIALADASKHYVKKLETGTKNRRAVNRNMATLNALNMLRLYLENNL